MITIAQLEETARLREQKLIRKGSTVGILLEHDNTVTWFTPSPDGGLVFLNQTRGRKLISSGTVAARYVYRLMPRILKELRDSAEHAKRVAEYEATLDPNARDPLEAAFLECVAKMYALPDPHPVALYWIASRLMRNEREVLKIGLKLQKEKLVKVEHGAATPYNHI